jgi:protocatechuate 3,4-dioxygenase beta subunit
MSNRYIIIIILFFKIFANQSIVLAQKLTSKTNTMNSSVCTKSKTYINNYEPRVFNKNNNLLSTYKSVANLCSEPIIIKGRLLDESCKPISDARVQIWQSGCDGKYPYLPLKNRVNRKFINLNSSSSFVGSGTAATNNAGEFHFITMLPGKDSLNYINIKVIAKNLPITQSKLFIDQAAKQKPAKHIYKDSLDNYSNYYFEIVVPKAKAIQLQ